MTAVVALLVMAILIAKSASLLEEVAALRRADRRRSRRVAGSGEARERALAQMDARVQEIAAEGSAYREEIERLRVEVADAERTLRQVGETPRRMMIVFDKASLGREKLWEVRVANPDIAARGPRSDGGDPIVTSWTEGRVYLLAAATAEEARDRCVARFPPHLGYQILETIAARLEGRGLAA